MPVLRRYFSLLCIIKCAYLTESDRRSAGPKYFKKVKARNTSTNSACSGLAPWKVTLTHRRDKPGDIRERTIN